MGSQRVRHEWTTRGPQKQCSPKLLSGSAVPPVACFHAHFAHSGMKFPFFDISSLARSTEVPPFTSASSGRRKLNHFSLSQLCYVLKLLLFSLHLCLCICSRDKKKSTFFFLISNSLNKKNIVPLIKEVSKYWYMWNINKACSLLGLKSSHERVQKIEKDRKRWYFTLTKIKMLAISVKDV